MRELSGDDESHIATSSEGKKETIEQASQGRNTQTRLQQNRFSASRMLWEKKRKEETTQWRNDEDGNSSSGKNWTGIGEPYSASSVTGLFTTTSRKG